VADQICKLVKDVTTLEQFSQGEVAAAAEALEAKKAGALKALALVG